MKYYYYGTFDTTTGVIGAVVKSDLYNLNLAIEQPDVIKLPNDKPNYYVDIGSTPPRLMLKEVHNITLNKSTIIADGEDECLLTGLSDSSIVIWPDGQRDEVTAGEVGLKTDLAGEYKFTVFSPKHFIKEIVIEAITPT